MKNIRFTIGHTYVPKGSNVCIHLSDLSRNFFNEIRTVLGIFT
jgi:hypothetical protein